MKNILLYLSHPKIYITFTVILAKYQLFTLWVEKNYISVYKLFEYKCVMVLRSAFCRKSIKENSKKIFIHHTK